MLAVVTEWHIFHLFVREVIVFFLATSTKGTQTNRQRNTHLNSFIQVQSDLKTYQESYLQHLIVHSASLICVESMKAISITCQTHVHIALLIPYPATISTVLKSKSLSGFQ